MTPPTPAPALRYRFGVVLDMLRASGKPIKCFGLTANGSPKHPLMLGYSTPLQDFTTQPLRSNK